MSQNKKIMRISLLFSSLLLSYSALAAPYTEVGYGGREGAYDINIGYQFTDHYSTEVSWINEGKQPLNIPNRNQVLSINLKYTTPIYKDFSVSVKGGISRMKQSNSGSFSPFDGYNIGINLNYALYQQAYVYGGVTLLHTMQEIGTYENFKYVDVGIGYQF
jgi:hypothetical protein